MITKYTGIRRLIFAGLNSYKGLLQCLRHESAFQQEVLLFSILVPILYFVEVTKIEVMFLIISLVIVLITELLNTAIEATIDRIGTEYHELSGQAKDISSAAVFISIGLCVFVWFYILVL